MDQTWDCPVCLESFPKAEVAFRFPSGRVWVFNPHAVVHLVHMYSWKPPEDFCQDVIGGGAVVVTEGIATALDVPRSVGAILADSRPLPDGFVRFLIELARTGKGT